MFLGKYSITLDEKSRFLVPARYRKNLSNGFYLAQGFDRNLWVLTKGAFEAIYRIISSQNLADPLVRLLLRMILSTTHEIRADQNGNITIPKDLKDFANIKQNILIIGQGDYFEIWDPTLWEKQETQLRDAGTNSRRFSSLSIVAR